MSRNKIAAVELLRLPANNMLFDPALVDDPSDFINGLLQAPIEYSIIGKGLDGTILLWNEGARGLYGYEPQEVVGCANSAVLHIPEDARTGLLRRMMETVPPIIAEPSAPIWLPG